MRTESGIIQDYDGGRDLTPFYVIVYVLALEKTVGEVGDDS